MAVFYGTKISPHITSLTDGGYLLCSSVPIARTGSQLYLPSEIECEGKESLKQKNGLIEVFREPEEVFSEKTIASFSGKPITDGHPMDSVNADNHAVYSKGTVMSARRGTGEFSDCILADLLISDSSLIEEIASGKRGISAGYGCRYEIKNGKLCQTDIICNHVAVVREGRAGKRIEIRDESPDLINKEKTMEENKKNIVQEEPKAVETCEKEKQQDECVSQKEGVKDIDCPDVVEELMSMLKDIKTRLEALESKQTPNALDELEKELSEQKEEKPEDDPVADEEAVTVSPEAMEERQEEIRESKALDSREAVRQLIKRIKPVVASLKDPKERQMMSDEMSAAMKKTVLKDNAKAVRENNYTKITRDSRPIQSQSFGELCRAMHPRYSK